MIVVVNPEMIVVVNSERKWWRLKFGRNPKRQKVFGLCLPLLKKIFVLNSVSLSIFEHRSLFLLFFR